MKISAVEIRDRIKALNAIGAGGITVVQSRRYIDADVISVGGKWYPVKTDMHATKEMHVTHADEWKSGQVVTNEVSWLDTAGPVNEVSYAGD